MPTNHSAIGTKRGTLLYQCLGINAMARKMRTRGIHIGEHTTGTAKDIILNLHTFVHRHIVLDADAVANAHIVAHIHILTEGASLPDTGTFLYMAEMPYLSVFSNDDIVVYIAAFVDKRIHFSICNYFMFCKQTARLSVQ